MDINEARLELLSALQKFIRRGLEYEALHTALELEENLHFNILWNRLKIIASEDVGPANQLMPILVESLYKEYVAEKTKLDKKPDDKAHLLFLSNAVVCLCRSLHNRTVDDLLNVVLLEREKNIGVPIPDYALDKHTARGRAMDRGWKEFFEEGSKLVNESGSNPWRKKHMQLRGCD